MTADGAALELKPTDRWHFGVPTILLAISTGICVQILVLLTISGGDPVDALCYWLTNPAVPYNRVQSAFGYSPVVAQLGAPLFQIPFPAFTFILRALEVASLVLLTGPLAGALIFTTPVASEINAANINLPIAVVMVLGFRWPALWAIPLLTKPTMGVGLLWFVFRREWRKAAIPIAIAGGLSLVSFAFDQRVWFEWLQWLRDNPPVGEWPYPYPVWARLPISLALVIWGARTNRPWTVPVASALALPRLYYQSPAILIAVVPLIPGLGRLVVPWTRRLARIDQLYPGRPAAQGGAGITPDRPATTATTAGAA